MAQLSTFLLKADIAVADEVLHTLSARREAQTKEHLAKVNHIAQELFGELPTDYDSLLSGGTFSLLYKLYYPNRTILIKLALNLPGYASPDFSKQIQLHQYLLQHGIEVPTVYSSNHHDYMVMDFIEGPTYEEMAHLPQVFDSIVERLGQELALVHQIPVDGFGNVAFQQERLKGDSQEWSSIVLTRLDEHLYICEKNAYLTRAECENTRSLFEEVGAFFNLKSSSLLHGDLGSKNVILQSNDRLCLLDWEDALGGDPVFDIAMWGSFVQNKDKLSQFMAGYYQEKPPPNDFYLRYFLYHYRLLLAKTVHRYRFQYCRKDQILPATRLQQAWRQLMEAMGQ